MAPPFPRGSGTRSNVPKVLPDYKVRAKERIAEAGLAVFAKKGFRKTTMADIAKEVGVSKADLYLYYPSKVELLREIQLKNQREARAQLSRLMQDQDWAEASVRLLDQVMEEAGGEQTWYQWFNLMAEVMADPTVREVMRNDFRADRRMVREFLERTSRPGRERTKVELDRLALPLMMLFYGAVIVTTLGADWPHSRTALRESIKAVIES